MESFQSQYSQGYFNNNEIRLNRNDVNDIVDAYTTIPNIIIARDAFVAMILKCPAVIKLKTLKQEQTLELEILMELYWLTWKIDVYDWLQMFGVAPWYWEKILHTEHEVPVVPPLLSGEIATFMDGKHKQHFRYYYNDTSKPAGGMYFETKGHAPMITGKLRSPVSTILKDYKTAKILREASELAWHQQARMQHVFEFHPPRNYPGDDNLVTLESFGENIAASVMRQQEELHNKKMNIRKSDMQQALMMAAYKNKGLNQKYGTTGYLSSETRSEQWERANASIVERGIPLSADFTYKPVPAPQIHANYVEIMHRLDQVSSAVMDIPANLLEIATTRAATQINVQGNIRIVNERIKEWINYFQRITKKVFLLGYGDMIQEELNHRHFHGRLKPDELISIYADQEVEVYMKCSPIAQISDIRQAWLDGMMKKKTATQHTFSILGIPQGEISLTEYPDMYPKELIQKVAVKNKSFN